MNLVKNCFFTLFTAIVLATAAVPFASANDEVVSAVSETININTATADEISAALSGVGPAKAQAIVAWREEFGGFQHLEELEEVKGIGASTIDKNKAKITLK